MNDNKYETKEKKYTKDKIEPQLKKVRCKMCPTILSGTG